MPLSLMTKILNDSLFGARDGKENVVRCRGSLVLKNNFSLGRLLKISQKHNLQPQLSTKQYSTSASGWCFILFLYNSGIIYNFVKLLAVIVR